MTPTLEIRSDIAILTLGSDENRFSPDWLDAVDAHLDQIERSARGLITVGAGKFYSNGLDLDWLMAHGDRADWYVDRVQTLFARILTFSIPTAAAVNGHSFGAGAMFAIAHDYRFMREDRGYYCFPEADINIPFTPGMSALIQAKLSPQTAMVAMTTGHRYGSAEALTAGLVDGVAAEDSVIDAALERLSAISGKDKATIGAIKTTMFASVTAALRQGRQ
ncbi:enoyl-CoA hydratase [Rhodococcus sp. 06-1477-1B]|uniref:enoyl-CoA hydratase/isomerase family protein n=1 Tax=Rhodococcus sp. 06-1474-1B TaxID=2022499 RepID=UPI000B9AA07C|nr:enoyl-CoA hydratase/isomerase family protein [Rhodococcus sp. 06-1474-1B]OZD44329.1 enoyl-CoA hydratase [Rhodococcus sp. 06-1474-1B]OZD59383.1 enoyl-CoA hydratase [Rhodococcus sp. 06-1477-1B]